MPRVTILKAKGLGEGPSQKALERMKKGLVVACLLALTTRSLAISFRLEPEVRKCVKEEVHKDVLVVGEYRLSDVPGQRTDLVVNAD